MPDRLSKKHVLVVAGPSASGKTTLIEKLLNNGDFAIQIFAKIGLDYHSSMKKINTQRLVNKRKLSKNKPINKSKIAIIHIDMLSSRREDRKRDLAHIAKSSKSFNVLTLCTSHEIWFRRISERMEMNQVSLWTPGVYFPRGTANLNSRWTPSSFAWRIIAASSFSKPIGRYMYKLEYKSWEKFWTSHCGISQYYFDSETKIFFPECPF